MIKLQNVNKVYNKRKRNELKVVDDTSITLPSKGFVTFLGTSGSGKSTLINCIGGLDKFNSGTISYDDDVKSKGSSNKLDKYRAQNIGYVFQHYYLIEYMTVEENVAMALDMINFKDKVEKYKKVSEALKLVGMENYRKRTAGNLSGGQQQRVAIARALVKDPKILICDEPTGNLDSKNTYNVMSILKQISQEKLVLLVTHEHEIAKFYSDSIITIKDGKTTTDSSIETSDLSESEELTVFLDEYKKEQPKNNDVITTYTKDNKKVELDIVAVNNKIFIKSKSSLQLIDNSNSRIAIFENSDSQIGNSNMTESNIDLSGIALSEDYKRTNFFARCLNDIKLYLKELKDLKTAKKRKIAIPIFIVLLSFFFLAVAQEAINLSTPNPYVTDIYMGDNVIGVDTYEIAKDSDFVIDDSVWVTSYTDYGSSKESITINYDVIDKYSPTERVSISYRDISNIKESQVLVGELTNNKYDIVISKKVADIILSFKNSEFYGIETYEDLLNVDIELSGLSSTKPVAIVNTDEISVYTSSELYSKIIYDADDYDYYYYWSDDYIYNNYHEYYIGQGETSLYETTYTDSLADNEILLSSYYEGIIEIGTTYHDSSSPTAVNTFTVVGFFELTEEYYSLVGSTSATRARIYSDNQVVIQANAQRIESIINLASYTSPQVVLIGDGVEEYSKYFSLSNIDYNVGIDIPISGNQEYATDSLIGALFMSVAIAVLLFIMFRMQLISNYSEISTKRILGYTKYQVIRQYAVRTIFMFVTYTLIPIFMMTQYYLEDSYDLQELSYVIEFNSVIIPIFVLLFVYLSATLLSLYLILIRKSPIQLINNHDM